ncbi:Atherinlike [Caligus rogercresseyi]|uniref:Atherinlike n=1 Tax=Caligus rogercresseyi TaxID=217165 RepID=A0A7T8H0Z1_CALRO|nr:Atherinlike [Caligus rogercresseyi]
MAVDVMKNRKVRPGGKRISNWIKGRWECDRAYFRVEDKDIPVVTAVAPHLDKIPLDWARLLMKSQRQAMYPLARSLS